MNKINWLGCAKAKIGKEFILVQLFNCGEKSLDRRMCDQNYLVLSAAAYVGYPFPLNTVQRDSFFNAIHKKNRIPYQPTLWSLTFNPGSKHHCQLSPTFSSLAHLETSRLVIAVDDCPRFVFLEPIPDKSTVACRFF